MNLELLKAPFPEEDIEWRIGQSGKAGNGRVWARCLAYVQARAIMNRLDEVCGPHGWKVSYRFIPASQGMEPGVICELSVNVDGGWVTKEDGAEQTDIESFKGGISSALKRAGSAWGIGRYLYNLESGYAEIVTDSKAKGAMWAKTKDGTEFYWVPPVLPQWALPSGAKAKTPPPNVRPQQPAEGDGFKDDTYTIPFGKFGGKRLEDVGPDDLRNYVVWLESNSTKTKKPISDMGRDFIQRVEKYVAAFESVPF